MAQDGGPQRVDDAAQAGGFTLREIKLLLDGFPAGTPPSARWRSIAEQKLPQLDVLIAQLTGMRRLITAGLACECVSIEDCLRAAGDEQPSSA